jgi:hypothetical protein
MKLIVMKVPEYKIHISKGKQFLGLTVYNEDTGIYEEMFREHIVARIVREEHETQQDWIRIRYESRYNKYFFWASEHYFERSWLSNEPENPISLDWLEEENPISDGSANVEHTLVEITGKNIDPEKYSLELLLRCLPNDEESYVFDDYVKQLYTKNHVS